MNGHHVFQRKTHPQPDNTSIKHDGSQNQQKSQYLNRKHAVNVRDKTVQF